MKLKIRDMTEDDLYQVLKIEHQNFPDPYLEWWMLMLLNSPEYKCVVGYDYHSPDTVVCYAFLRVNFNESHLHKVSVIQQKMNQSIGTQMMQHLLSLSNDEDGGFNEMWLEVRESNESALHLYEKLGFKVHCKREGYYQHVDYSNNETVVENAIMMVKKGLID